MSDEVQFEILDVTPELAMSWLTDPSYIAPNRILNQRIVERYVAEMRAGRWTMTGEAIKFNTAGCLVDGQHRLNAIAQSGVTCTLPVVRGLPIEAQDVMDSGRPRRASDVLAIHATKHAGLVAAAARILVMMERPGGLPHGNAASAVSNAELLAYVETNPDVTDLADHIAGSRNKYPMPQSSYLAALVHMARRDGDAAIDFDHHFRHGAGLNAHNPILTLRERFILVQARRERVSNYVMVSSVLRTWNCWRKGEALTKLQFYKNSAPIAIPDKLR